jgi:hypothetical protein
MIGGAPALTSFVPCRAGLPTAYPFWTSSRTAVR